MLSQLHVKTENPTDLQRSCRHYQQVCHRVHQSMDMTCRRQASSTAARRSLAVTHSSPGLKSAITPVPHKFVQHRSTLQIYSDPLMNCKIKCFRTQKTTMKRINIFFYIGHFVYCLLLNTLLCV